MPVVVGITGGIGTGKSTVLRMLADLGALTLSADDLAREALSKDSPAYREVVERFGSRVVTPSGEIDRAALGEIVFADPEARGSLEKMIHPQVIERMRREIASFRSDPSSGNAVMALEIPLLIECGLESMVDRVVVVRAEQETQVRRLTMRGAMSRDNALLRIAAQMPLARKIERADVVIANDGDIESLERSVRSVWDEIRLL